VIVSAAFEPGATSHVRLTFNTDVGKSLAATDFRVTAFFGGPLIPVTYTYDPATRVADVALAGLADNNYRMTVFQNDVTDAANTAMTATFVYDFFTLAGDVTHDRVVNFADLLVLARNYNAAGATWASGDLDGNGTVNFNDLLILARAYNKSLPAPAPLPETAPTSAAMAVAPVLVEEAKAKPVFSTTRVVKPPPAPVKPKAVARPKAR